MTKRVLSAYNNIKSTLEEYMELIVINSEKLKVILTAEDMQKLDITSGDLDYETPHTKRAFWEILDKAKLETGFDTIGSKLYVQVYPSRDGGCEMYVTKFFSQEKAKITEPKGEEKEHTAVILESEEELILLCKRLSRTYPFGKSTVYLKNDGKYLLLLSGRKKPAYVKRADLENLPSFLEEYGRIYFPDALGLAHLKEHSRKLVSEGAVELFARIF